MFFFSAFAAILFLFGSSQNFLCVNGLAIPNPRYPLSTEATIGSGNIMERQLNNNDQDGDIAAIVPRASTMPPSILAQPRPKPQEDPGEQDERVDPPTDEIPEEPEIDTPDPPDAPDECKWEPLTEEEEIRCNNQ